MKVRKIFPNMKLLPLIALLFVGLSSCDKDEDPEVRPQVSSTDPINDATGIALNNKLSAAFSVTMDASTSTKFTVKHGSANVTGISAYNGTTASFIPAADLLPNTIYTATISKTAINTKGVSMLNDYTWSFTTGALADVINPTVTLSAPGSNATGIALNNAIVMTFSESMDQNTINTLTYTLKKGTTSVEGEVTSTGTTATFTPSANLTANTLYTATITTGVKDMAGNALALSKTVTFTTGNGPDTSLPMINSQSPLSNATGITLDKVVSLVFNEEMNPSTIASSFTLKRGTTTVSGTVDYEGTTATFTPAHNLEAGIEYTAAISTGAKDLAGNALAVTNTWKFTTGTSLTLAPVNLGTAGNYVILAKTAITNISSSAVTGDLGLSPAALSFVTGFALTAATGYATTPEVTGKVYAADMAPPTSVNLTTAVENMITAYNDAAGRPTPDFSELATGNIGGKTLTPGLYKWTSTVTVPSNVTLSGGPNDVWIFQIDGDLTMSTAVRMTLNGGARAKNIFWQVAGQVTLGSTTHFEGIVLSMTGITLQTGASMNGRALAQTAVILDQNIVKKP